MSGESGGRIRLAKLNDQLTCKLCGGYFIDATTIIECLHSFCKSCIVKYLETNKYCPICEVQVHKSKPLLNIRPDHTLQDIVYKLVPGCYQNEMRCRREFYGKNPDAKLISMSPEARGEPIESHIYSPDESLSLSLEYYNPNLANDTTTAISPVEESKETVIPVNPSKVLPKRYLRCPAAVTVFHLQKLLRAKYGLSDVHRVDVMYKEEPLCSNYTLMDVMYIYHWRRKVPLHLSYRIFESSPKRLKLSDDNTHFQESLNNAGICQPMEMKEVQLKISETGVMSFTGVSGSSESKKDSKNELNVEVDNQTTLEVVKSEEKQITADEKESISAKKNIGEEEKKSTDNEKKLNVSKTFSEKKAISNNNNNSNNTSTNTNNSNNSNNSSSSSSSNSNNNNNNNNNSNSGSNTQESTSKLETREKSKNAEISQLPSGSGSKIDALSVKLQFQPKVGQINNTYSKKPIKEKKTILEKVLKKSDNKNIIVDGQKEIQKNPTDKSRSVTSLTIYPSKSNSTNKSTSSVVQSGMKGSEVFNTSSVPFSTISTSSLSTSSGSILISTRRNSSPDRNKESNSNNSNALSNFSKKGNSLNENNEACNQKSSLSTNSKGLFTRQNSSSNESSNIGVNSNVSTLIGNISQPESSYGIQNLINSTMKNTLKNSGLNIGQKTTITSVPMTTQVNLQSSSTSTYSISNITKTTYSANVNNSGSNNSGSNSGNNSNNSNNNVNNNGSNQSGNSSTKQENTKGNSEINVYAVPPCPDAIPISLMKPTVRKTEIISKGTNLNEICAKIGTSGSKINDICAKIGEHSKEKNKAEKSRPEIPDLLKITKKSITSTSNDMVKHISNIPNVPIYTPSSLLGSKNNELNKESGTSSTATTTLSTSSAPSGITASSSMLTTTVLSSLSSSMSVTTTTLSTPTTLSLISSHMSGLIGKGNSVKKSQTSAIGYKTLRDPPKSWNPTLSKNNYLAAKNQAKEIQNIQITSLNSSEVGGSSLSGGKPIMSKPAKIFKMRNMPRYLGNPASGVKPMYSVNNDSKEGKDQQSGAATSSKNTVTTTGLSSMTKIDPKTLAPIVSTNTNSSIISLPPYSPNRSYQNTPFSRASGSSALSPRNSPVNMLSTNPFIPSPTPNTNPRLIYSHFPPPAFATDASRFPNPLIRSPIGIPPPSAFHSSLPPSINKLYQRSSYIPQTTTTAYSQGLTTQPVSTAIQRIPSSNYSSPSKSSKTIVVSNSTLNVKNETSASTSLENIVHLKGISHDSNVFNLSTTTGIISNYVSDLSKSSSSLSTAVEGSTNSTTSTKFFGNDRKNEDKKEDEEKNNKNKSIKEKEKVDDEKKSGDISNKEPGEILEEKGKGDEELNEKDKQSEDKNKDKKDKLVKKKGKEIDKKITKRVLRKDSNDSDKNAANTEDSKTSESSDSSSPKNEVIDQLTIKVNGNPGDKSNDQYNDGSSSKQIKDQGNESMNQHPNNNFSTEDEKSKKSNKSSAEETDKNTENREGNKGESQKKEGD